MGPAAVAWLSAAGDELVAAVTTELPAWLNDRQPPLSTAQRTALSSGIIAELAALVALPAAEMRRTPVQVAREALAGAGVEASDLNSLAQLGEASGEAVLRWGAARAAVHLADRANR